MAAEMDQAEGGGGLMPLHGAALCRGFSQVQYAVELVLSTSDVRAPRLNATPLIALSLTTDDGRVLQYKLTQQELAQWRYTLARAVKDLDYLERKRRPAATNAAKRR